MLIDRGSEVEVRMSHDRTLGVIVLWAGKFLAKFLHDDVLLVLLTPLNRTANADALLCLIEVAESDVSCSACNVICWRVLLDEVINFHAINLAAIDDVIKTEDVCRVESAENLLDVLLSDLLACVSLHCDSC